MPDIIVFHTAWMAKYDGDRASLSAGGFKFAAENGYGHELFNFRNTDGTCYATCHLQETCTWRSISMCRGRLKRSKERQSSGPPRILNKAAALLSASGAMPPSFARFSTRRASWPAGG